MATLSSLLSALEPHLTDCERYSAVAQAGIDGSSMEVNSICRAVVDDNSREILLVCARPESVMSPLTIASLLEALQDLSATRPDYTVELTSEACDADSSSAALVRINFPVVGFSISERDETVVLRWTS